MTGLSILPRESIMSRSAIEPVLSEIPEWRVFDANVRVGRSGVHGDLALEGSELLSEMSHFGISNALVSHFVAEEYGAEEGNRALACDLCDRFEPAWAALPDEESIHRVAQRNPRAVRLCFGAMNHNFSPSSWCAGELYAYLQERSILAVVAREEIAWDALAALLADFPRLRVLLLETGYRSDRYLFPLLRRFPNLYFETSTYVAHRQLEAYVDQFGAERALFGSRLPLYNPAAALAILMTARISDDAKRAIAGGTLRSLLGRRAE